MRRGLEKLGRALARAIRSLEFDARLADGEPLEADVVEGGVGGPRVEIRHPRLESRGVFRLVAVIALEPAPAITYAVPAYPADDRAGAPARAPREGSMSAAAIAPPAPLALPVELKGHELVVSVSGGKDSTAAALALREAEIPARYVFADTGWEAPEVYGYLDTLRERLSIRIDVVGPEGGMVMVEHERYRAGFPARTMRWCTRELKLEPIRATTRSSTTNWAARARAWSASAARSARRAAMPVLDRESGGPAHLGLVGLAPVDRVVARGRARGPQAPRHPCEPALSLGADRVGCFRCIFASKNELRLLAVRAPERIEEIAAPRRSSPRFAARATTSSRAATPPIARAAFRAGAMACSASRRRCTTS